MNDVPQAAIDAAAVVLHDEYCDDGETTTCGRWNSKVPGGYDPQRHIGYYQERAREVLAAAAPHLYAAERERIYAELGNEHLVIFTEDAWTMEHSVDCRLSGAMADTCEYWLALKRAAVTDEPRPEMLGRWKITGIDSEGLPSLERAEVPGA